MIISKRCPICQKEFSPHISNVKRGMGKYCSQQCYWQTLRGRKQSIKQIEKRLKFLPRGESHYKWKGGAYKRICLICGKEFSTRFIENRTYSRGRNLGRGRRGLYCSLRCAGKNKISNLGKYAEKGNIPWDKGRKLSFKAREKMRKHSLLHPRKYWLGKRRLDISGERNWNWKGGISLINKTEKQLIQHTIEYKQWRRKVFERDNYICQFCGEDRGGNLQAHHIYKFNDYLELRFKIGNGITVCKKCHETFINSHEKDWESYFEFLINIHAYTIKTFALQAPS